MRDFTPRTAIVASYGIGREEEGKCEENPEAAGGVDEVEYRVVHGRRLQWKKSMPGDREAGVYIYVCMYVPMTSLL